MIELISPHEFRTIQIQPNDRVVQLKPFQDQFIFSLSRYPAFVGGWGTGKSMCLIEKFKLAAEEYPGNVLLMIRKEYTDLKDSTIKDWEENTGIEVNSSREAVFPNGSVVMFRHGEELTKNNLSNMNLGGFGIEQGEEFEGDMVFFMLTGRLRRKGVRHFGGVIANQRGHNWIHRLWKAQTLEGFELIEATSFDNADVLPPETVADWRRLEVNKPALFRQFVMNSWDEDGSPEKCISPAHVQAARLRLIPFQKPIYRIIGIDVARTGKDKTVMYALENTKILGRMELEKKDTMEVVGYALKFAQDHKAIQAFSVDELNAGAGVADRLKELGKEVIFVNSSRKSNLEKFANIRAEVWGFGSQVFETGLAELHGDSYPELCDQLTWSKWKRIESNLVLQVELKEDIIKLYGRSPDDADAYLYGRWGMQFIKPVYEEEFNPMIQTPHPDMQTGGFTSLTGRHRR